MVQFYFLEVFNGNQLPGDGSAMPVNESSFFLFSCSPCLEQGIPVICSKDEAPLLVILFSGDAVAFDTIDNLCSVVFHMYIKKPRCQRGGD